MTDSTYSHTFHSFVIDKLLPSFFRIVCHCITLYNSADFTLYLVSHSVKSNIIIYECNPRKDMNVKNGI